VASSAETILFEVEVQTDDTATEQLGQVDSQVESLESSFQDLQQRSQISSQELQNATVVSAQGASRSMNELSSSVSSTANNLSFELVQGAQDASFGLAGVANQIPLISEQFTRLQSQTGSTKGALTALASSLTGPTGILAAGTLLVQFGPQLLDFMGSLGEKAASSEERISSLKEATSSVLQGFQEDIPKVEITDLGAAEQGRRALEEQITQREKAIEKAERLRELEQDVSERDLELARGRSPSDFSDPDLQARVAQAQELLRLREEYADANGEVSRFLDRQQDTLDRERGALKRINELIEERRRKGQQQPIVAGLPGFEEVEDEQEEGPEVSTVEGLQQLQAASPVEIPIDDASVELASEGLQKILDDFRRLDDLGRAGVLPREEVLKRKMRILDQALQQAIKNGNEEMAKLIQRLQEETEGALEALSAGGEAQSATNSELTQGIRLAAQLGATMKRAAKESEQEWNERLGSVLQQMGALIALANPVAGAVVGGTGTVLQAFDEGGYTGRGSKYEPAGVVHRDEFVFSKEATQGNVAALGELHRAMQKGISVGDIYAMTGVPGYAEGGFVGQVTRSASAPSSSGGGAARQEEIQRAADEAARRVGKEVAAAVSKQPNIVRVGRRGSKDIVEAGEEEMDRKNPEG